MKSYNVAALTALLSAGAQAVPMAGHGHNHAKDLRAHMHHAKRDIIWETAYEVETVTVVKTVFEDGSPAGGAYQTIYPTDKPSSSAVVTSSKAPTPSSSSPAETYSNTPAPVPTSETYAPVPTSSSSTYVAPPPSSTTQAPPPPSSSSEAPVPPPSSSYVAPPPSDTTTYAPPPSTTESAPAPSATYGSGGSGSGSVAPGTYTGEFTHWDPALGACGVTSTGTEDVVAISKIIFDKYTPNGNPNKNPLCGTKVTMTGKDGKAYPATIVDRCEGCKEPDLDLTITLFNKVTSNGDGRVPDMDWSM